MPYMYSSGEGSEDKLQPQLTLYIDINSEIAN